MLTRAEILANLQKAREPRVKLPKPIAQKSEKKKAQEAAEKKERGGGLTDLQKWYADKITKLSGKCLRCGEKYDKNNQRLAIAAVAHILAKRESMFPSVALHNENWVELSATCGCHAWLDQQASWEEILLSPIGPIVLEKFLIMEPKIKERHLIPEVLAQEIPPKL